MKKCLANECLINWLAFIKSQFKSLKKQVRSHIKQKLIELKISAGMNSTENAHTTPPTNLIRQSSPQKPRALPSLNFIPFSIIRPYTADFYFGIFFLFFIRIFALNKSIPLPNQEILTKYFTPGVVKAKNLNPFL